jgi:hypothetical protein
MVSDGTARDATTDDDDIGLLGDGFVAHLENPLICSVSAKQSPPI